MLSAIRCSCFHRRRLSHPVRLIMTRTTALIQPRPSLHWQLRDEAAQGRSSSSFLKQLCSHPLHARQRVFGTPDRRPHTGEIQARPLAAAVKLAHLVDDIHHVLQAVVRAELASDDARVVEAGLSSAGLRVAVRAQLVPDGHGGGHVAVGSLRL